MVAVAVVAAVWVAVREDPTRLQVSVTGLPEGVPGRVEVAGPVTYAVTGATDEREVPAGRYTLRIRAAKTGKGTAYPELDEQRIVVREGQTNRARAEYVTEIPDTTKVLDQRKPGIIRVDGRKVTFARGSKSVPVLKPGHIFIVAEGPQPPHLLVRRIDKVTPGTAGIVVDTTPVSFSDALPSGRFRLNAEVAIRPAMAGRDGFVIRPAYDPPPALTVNFMELVLKRGKDDPGCRSSEHNAAFMMEIGALKPKLGGTIDWGIAPPRAKVDITATLNPRISLSLRLNGSIKCEFKLEKQGGFAWLNKFCGKVIGTLVRIGPVSLSCSVEPSVKVGLKAEAAVKYTFGATVSGGIEHSLPKFAVTDPGMEEMEMSVLKGAKPILSTYAELGLDIGLYGGDPLGVAKVGVKLAFGAGPELRVMPKHNVIEANLKFTFAVKPTISVELPLKQYEKEFKAVEFIKRWRLWSAEGRDHQKTQPPPPCPSEADTRASFGISDYYEIHDWVCAGNYVAARYVDSHGLVGPVVMWHGGGGLSEFAGSHGHEGNRPQCDAEGIKDAPDKIREYVGCRYWRTKPPQGSAPAGVVADQRRLVEALRDNDAATACELAAHVASELFRGTGKPCEETLAELKRELGPFSSAAPAPELTQAVPGPDGLAYSYLRDSDLRKVLIWEKYAGMDHWQLRYVVLD